MNPDQLLLKRLESNANAIATKYALYTSDNSRDESSKTSVRQTGVHSNYLEPDELPKYSNNGTSQQNAQNSQGISNSTLNDSSILMTETISFIKDTIEKNQDPSSDQILNYINQLINSKVSPSGKLLTSPSSPSRNETINKNSKNFISDENFRSGSTYPQEIIVTENTGKSIPASETTNQNSESGFQHLNRSKFQIDQTDESRAINREKNIDSEIKDSLQDESPEDNYLDYEVDAISNENEYEDNYNEEDTTFEETPHLKESHLHYYNTRGETYSDSASSSDVYRLRETSPLSTSEKKYSPNSKHSQSPHNIFSFDSPRNLQPYDFHSPTGSGTIRSSSHIIRSVLNNNSTFDHPSKSRFDFQSDYNNADEGYETSSTNAEYIPTEIQIPRPPTDQLEEKIIYYLKYLTNKSEAVRSDAVLSLKNIYLSILNGSQSIEICENNYSFSSLDDFNVLKLYAPTIVDELILCLEEYTNQDDECNIMIIESLGLMGERAVPSIPLLLRLIRDPSLYALYESILNSMFSMGNTGLETLLDAASSSTSEWDSFILTHIANHPLIQEHIIVPTLIREAQVGDSVRRLTLLRSLAALGARASSKATSILLNILISGSLNRKEISTIIRYCGPQGEQMLTYLMSQNHNPRIRACSAFSFGSSVSFSSNLRVIANTDFTSLFTTSPKLNAFGFDQDISTLKEPIQSLSEKSYLLFDARELIAALNRLINEGGFPDISHVAYKVDPSITELLIEVNEKHRAEYKDEHSIAQNISGSHDETSLQMLKNSIRSSSFLRKHAKSDGKQEYKIAIPEKSTIRALGEAVLDGEETVRIAASYAIGCIGMPYVHSVVGNLCASLKDQSNKVRAQSIESIGMLALGFRNIEEKKDQSRIKDETSSLMLPLTKCLIPLLRDSHYNVRFQAIRSIREYGYVYEYDEEIHFSVLKEIMRVLRDGTVNRNEVTETLVALGDRGIYQLLDILRHETHHNSKVRMSAAHGLSFSPIERTSTMDSVVETLFHASNDRIPLVRKTVIHTLGVLALKAKESLTYLRAQSLLPFMYSFLKDPEKCVRETAAEVLAQAGPRGELLLVEGVLKDSNPVIRCSAGYGLMHVGPKCVRTLLLALNDKDPHVSRAVAHALEQIGATAIVNSLKNRPKSAQLSVLSSVKDILLIIQLIPNSTSLNKLLHKIKDSLEENIHDTHFITETGY